MIISKKNKNTLAFHKPADMCCIRIVLFFHHIYSKVPFYIKVIMRIGLEYFKYLFFIVEFQIFLHVLNLVDVDNVNCNLLKIYNADSFLNNNLLNILVNLVKLL